MKFSATRAGMPASSTVGMSGAICERVRDVTASGRSFSALMCGTFCGSVSMEKLSRPAMRSVIIGALPR